MNQIDYRGYQSPTAYYGFSVMWHAVIMRTADGAVCFAMSCIQITFVMALMHYQFELSDL